MKFLVPVDFSKHARSASEYAVQLAALTNSSIHFLHVINPVIDSNPALVSEMWQVKSEINDRLKEWCNDFRKKTNLVCYDLIATGELKEEVANVATVNDIDLIIMGTKGAKGIYRLFGTNTVNVIKNTSCPVLTIPESISFSAPRRIVYATDYEMSDVDALARVSRLAAPFKAEIIVVHIIDEEESTETELSVIDYFSDLIKNNIVYGNIKFEVYRSSNAIKGIQSFVKKTGANFLVLATRKRNFFQKLFDKSLAQEFAFHGDIPLITFHVHESVEH